MTAQRATPCDPAADRVEAGILATIDDYYRGWHDGDAERVARSLHPALAKRGWLRAGDEAFLDDDGFDAVTRLAAAGEGRVEDPAEAVYRVRTVDVDGDIAAASVLAAFHVDYLHLVRTRDGWRIVHALWRGATDDARWRW